jgi:3-dehydroquinate synthase
VPDSFLSVRVNLHERAYDIRIGSGTLALLGKFLNEPRQLRRAFIITDDHVAAHASSVAVSLKAAGTQVDTIVVPSGEKTKSITQADQLWNRLLQLGADRQSSIVAVGGGVVGDLAGFVAATYARGLPYVQVPTTLLAQVDSSVGGKVGVNLPYAKNMVGAFWQPATVCIDTQTLRTLPEREYLSGLAEVVKYGVILDAEFFARLERDASALIERQSAVLQDVIARCCQLKADVVQADEREETGHRAILNYGHTFAHAFEAVTGYGQLLHGEAVSIGMMCAARLAELLHRVDDSFVQRQLALLTALNLPVTLPQLEVQAVLQAMQRDKKTNQGQLQFVLPTRLGHVELVGGVDISHVRAALPA